MVKGKKLPQWAKWSLVAVAGVGLLNLIRKVLPYILSYAVVFLFAVSGKSMTGDWFYDLPNDYAIWRVNSREILVGVESEHSLEHTLERYVSSFCYNGQWIGLQCVDVPEDLQEEINFSQPDYYLINMYTHEITGPMTLEAYREATVNFADMTDWIATVPAPDGAKY